MVKDTVHTTELDSLYMRGVQAIRDRDYETAISILKALPRLQHGGCLLRP